MYFRHFGETKKMLQVFATLLIALSSPTAASDAACPAQPMPPALEALKPLDGVRTIAFSATPSLAYPRRAWVVRMAQSSFGGPANLEIVRLRGQEDCNRYDIDKSWTASISEERLNAVINAVAPIGTPPADQFLAHDPMRSLDEIGIDGTGIVLRLSDFSWETTRRLHNGGRGGAAVSAIMHSLVSEHVPVPDRPTKDWY